MKKVGIALIEMLILVALATGIGLVANGKRGKDEINLHRNYKPNLPVVPPDTYPAIEPNKPVTGVNPVADPNAVVVDTDPNAAGVVTDPCSVPDDDPEAQAIAAEHPFHVISLACAKSIFEDPKFADGYYRFVDARNDELYNDGHIPGALHCDYYRLDYYLPTVLPDLIGAQKIVIYCNGGECEDSLYLCQELLNTGEIPSQNLYLFHGGWDAWSAAGLPTESGGQEGQ